MMAPSRSLKIRPISAASAVVVSASQSQSSGKREFHPKAGVYGYSVNGGWQHQFDKNWSSMVAVERMNLSGKVKGSPIIKKKGSWTGMAGVQYQF